jgi:hypothetical protein
MANGWVGKYQISTGAGDERRRDPIWILQKIFVLQHIYVSGLRGECDGKPTVRKGPLPDRGRGNWRPRPNQSKIVGLARSNPLNVRSPAGTFVTPAVLVPQATTLPMASNARLLKLPLETSTALVVPGGRFVSPKLFCPHGITVPSASNATLWPAPPFALNTLPLVTLVGRPGLDPQRTSIPSAFTAREPFSPHEMATTFVAVPGVLVSPRGLPPQAMAVPSDFSARM